MCAPPFETYFFQFHALFTWKQDVRPPHLRQNSAPPIWKILDPPLNSLIIHLNSSSTDSSV